MEQTKSNSKVGVIGLIILLAAVFLAPNLSFFFLDLETPGNTTIAAIMGVAAFGVGLMLGFKIPTQKDRIKNAVGIGLFSLIFFWLTVLPSSSTGIVPIIAYGAVLVLPTLVGAMLGGLKKR